MRVHTYLFMDPYSHGGTYTQKIKRGYACTYMHAGFTHKQNPNKQMKPVGFHPPWLCQQVVGFVNPLPICMPSVEALLCP